MKLEQLKRLSGITEATVDDQFNIQLHKIQDGISKLNDIVDKMNAPGSITKPVGTQKTAIRYAVEDLKKLSEKL